MSRPSNGSQTQPIHWLLESNQSGPHLKATGIFVRLGPNFDHAGIVSVVLGVKNE
jgi:hypothetical protein